METRLIIINGLSASGKTTLSKKLAKDLSIPVFSYDNFKELLADNIGYTDHESTKVFKKTATSILCFVAKECLRNNFSVIVEGLPADDDADLLVDFASGLNIKTCEIVCHANGKTLVDRFSERRASSDRHSVHSTASEEDFKKWAEEIISGNGKSAQITTDNILEIDTNDFSKIDYSKIIEFIK